VKQQQKNPEGYADFHAPVKADIIAQTIEKLAVDIVAQTLAKINVDIVAQTIKTLAIDIAAQTLAKLNVDLVAQTIDKLSVDIVAQKIATLIITMIAPPSPPAEVMFSSLGGDLTYMVTGSGTKSTYQERTGIGGKKVRVYSVTGGGTYCQYREGADAYAMIAGVPTAYLIAFDPTGAVIGWYPAPITYPFEIGNVDVLRIEICFRYGGNASNRNPTHYAWDMVGAVHFEVLE